MKRQSRIGFLSETNLTKAAGGAMETYRRTCWQFMFRSKTAKGQGFFLRFSSRPLRDKLLLLLRVAV
jgi:hypothetical protein